VLHSLFGLFSLPAILLWPAAGPAACCAGLLTRQPASDLLPHNTSTNFEADLLFTTYLCLKFRTRTVILCS
jgi:hypothetical protein